MPRLKLDKHQIEHLPAPDPSGKQTFYWDKQLPGFGLLVSGKTDAKTYVAQRRLPDGTARRVTIGSAAVLDLKKARRLAQGKLGDLLGGVDPQAEKLRRQRAGVTLREVLESYFKARKDLRVKSATDYRLAVERYMTPWLDLPIRSVSGVMVEMRHREIKNEIERRQRYNGEATANGAMRVFRLLWNFAAERDPDMPANPVPIVRRASARCEEGKLWQLHIGGGLGLLKRRQRHLERSNATTVRPQPHETGNSCRILAIGSDG